MKEWLNEKVPGFSGITHYLISVMLFLLMWLIPFSLSLAYIMSIKTSYLFTFIVFLVIGGAALLPDLDSSPLQEGSSTAVFQLGFFGVLLSVVFITISGAIYSLLHTKYDEKPKSQHRMFWHTFLVPLLIFIIGKFFLPKDNTIVGIVKEEGFIAIVMHASILLFIILVAISAYLGSNMLFYKLFRLIGKGSLTQVVSYIAMFASIYLCVTSSPKNAELLMTAVALGCWFHILGDLITQGSAPIFFPIPIPVNGHITLWHKPRVMGRLAIQTGGAVNTILNFVLFCFNVLLVYVIFYA